MKYVERTNKIGLSLVMKYNDRDQIFNHVNGNTLLRETIYLYTLKELISNY